MVSDLFFESVNERVRRICNKFHYDCSFSRFEDYFLVYSHLNRLGRPVITGSLVDSVSSIDGVSLVSFSVDDDVRLYAKFNINEKLD